MNEYERWYYIMKILFVVIDGLGDRPIKEFNGKTPLEEAETPTLDYVASQSVCGLLYALGRGIRPSSDVAHMSLFGADYKRYYTGRGPIELSGLGIEMGEKDIAFRGNFAVMSTNGTIIDRRANRTTPSCEILKEISEIDLKKSVFRLHHIAEHRFALQVIGENLSAKITDNDPHIENIQALKVLANDNSLEALKTAELINEYIEYVNTLLNKKYMSGNSTCNSILLRSVGSKPHFYDFALKNKLNACCCITNNALYNGIGSLFGMKVMLPKRYQNIGDFYKNLPNLVLRSLKENDFTFLHLQEPDLFGEDGDALGKKCSIERIDKSLSFLPELLEKEEIIVSVTADHATPCNLKMHSGDAVPIMISGYGVLADNVCNFSERSCSNGSLGVILGRDLVPILLNLAGKAPLIGG